MKNSAILDDFLVFVKAKKSFAASFKSSASLTISSSYYYLSKTIFKFSFTICLTSINSDSKLSKAIKFVSF